MNDMIIRVWISFIIIIIIIYLVYFGGAAFSVVLREFNYGQLVRFNYPPEFYALVIVNRCGWRWAIEIVSLNVGFL